MFWADPRHQARDVHANLVKFVAVFYCRPQFTLLVRQADDNGEVAVVAGKYAVLKIAQIACRRIVAVAFRFADALA